MTLPDHFKFSPSGASRWLSCPGSLTLPYVDSSSTYAAEGTAAHSLVVRCYLTSGNPEDFIGQEIDGFEVTEEMAQAVQMFLDTIDVHLEELPGENKQVLLETKIQHSIIKDFGGTIDCLLLSDRAIAVADFKYGAGVSVKVDQNPQLLCYLWLAWNCHLDIMPMSMKYTIVQPRARHADGPVRSSVITSGELERFIDACKVAMQEPEVPTFNYGSHCRWCPGKASCPELRRVTLELAQEEFSEDDMTPELAADLLSKAGIVKRYFEAISAWVRASLEHGESVPGYKLVEALGNRRYKLAEEEIVKLCRNRKFGKKQIYEAPKLLSPAQLEKVVGKGLVAGMTERPLKGTIVVPESDRRDAVQPGSAADEFKDADNDD